MSNILFTHAYFLRLDPKQWAIGQPYAPLGTLYATSLLRDNGFAVAFHDSMFASGPEDLLPALEKQSPQFLVICEDGFNYLTKMCLTNMREAAFQLCDMGKSAGCTVIVSGSDATDHYTKYLDAGADYIIQGEVEQTLLELIQHLKQGHTDLSNIKGIVFRQDNQLIRTLPRPVMKDLDTLPFPAWELIDMEPYRVMWMKSTGYFSMNMGTTRGCPFKCNWCAKPIYGNRYNSRSPENVVRELKMLKDKFQFDHIWFCDDIFGLKAGWVKSFAGCLQKENFRLRFKIQTRADLLLQENYVADLAQAGCVDAWMGAESGSQKILDAMDKGIRVEQIYTATRLLKAHHIQASFFIQFGYPGENKTDIHKTIRMIKELLPDNIGISVSYPLPGTGFYENVKTELKEKANWTDSDELQLMFRNSYPPVFYKKLHRYVHHEFRRELGRAAFKKVLKNPFAAALKDYRKVAAACWHMPALWIEKNRINRYAFANKQ